MNAVNRSSTAAHAHFYYIDENFKTNLCNIFGTFTYLLEKYSEFVTIVKELVSLKTIFPTTLRQFLLN
jgi:hypothetical protein